MAVYVVDSSAFEMDEIQNVRVSIDFGIIYSLSESMLDKIKRNWLSEGFETEHLIFSSPLEQLVVGNEFWVASFILKSINIFSLSLLLAVEGCNAKEDAGVILMEAFYVEVVKENIFSADPKMQLLVMAVLDFVSAKYAVKNPLFSVQR